MAPIQVDRIISVSSEDQAHKAENILNVSDSHQTWRCKSGENQATVILQFLKPSVISSIDVGNDNSAFVEIFVGKSTSDEFQVLLVTSSLMTLHECKNGLNVNKVRFFDTDHLSLASKESWDRVKIVCTQPYIKQSKYGLSFVTFHSKDIPQKEPIQSQSIQLGSFTLRNDDESDDILSAGRLFSKRNEHENVVRMPESPVSRLLAIHKKNLETGKNKDTNSTNINTQTPIVNQAIFKPSKDSVKPKNIDLNVKKNDINTMAAVKNTAAKKKDSIPSSSNLQPSRKKIKLIKNPLPATKLFNQLLNDVVFVMSGYENPYRSNIRSKALEMGAKYKHNWDPSCTHLICAFINTPKYNECKRQGTYRIVTSDWIDKCHSIRCRFPWRRYALDKMEQNQPESEDEICALTDSVETDDTDDEWNSVSAKQVPSTSQTNSSENQQNTTKSLYDLDTDIDSDLDIPKDLLADESILPLPYIDDIFRDRSFYLSTNLKPLIRQECNRYIIALEGKFSEKDKCDYIVSTDANHLQFKNAVTPQWIWDCYDARKILPLT
ncbi:PREDICTED: DNA repair protein XRCC1 [Diuraphis noxia]|uniref:DNA repair protein XRCC1 n=1 Tax=Diuraphis noxia TaxID=143948 RepID=UPI0007635591|nr:PREDICTED: DNA repair protein XRCC1 [Diuraphis noxia]